MEHVIDNAHDSIWVLALTSSSLVALWAEGDDDVRERLSCRSPGPEHADRDWEYSGLGWHDCETVDQIVEAQKIDRRLVVRPHSRSHSFVWMAGHDTSSQRRHSGEILGSPKRPKTERRLRSDQLAGSPGAVVYARGMQDREGAALIRERWET